MSLMTIRLPLLLLSLGGLLAACSSAEVPPIIAERQDNLSQIAGANRGIRDELENPEPSIEVIRTNSAILSELLPQLPTWFPEGTGPETGAETEALPVIWERWSDFEAAHGRAVAAVEALAAAIDTEDLEQIRTAAGEVGPNCGGCHDTFRLDD